MSLRGASKADRHASRKSEGDRLALVLAAGMRHLHVSPISMEGESSGVVDARSDGKGVEVYPRRVRRYEELNDAEKLAIAALQALEQGSPSTNEGDTSVVSVMNPGDLTAAVPNNNTDLEMRLCILLSTSAAARRLGPRQEARARVDHAEGVGGHQHALGH